MDAPTGVGDAGDATAATWAGVGAPEVAKVLTSTDVWRARLQSRALPAFEVLATLMLHFALASPGEQTIGHQTVVILLGLLAIFSLGALVTLLVGHRGFGKVLPAPPAGDLDRADLSAFLNRDTFYRLRRGGGVGSAAAAGLAAHVVFLLGHMPTRAPANLAALAVLGLAGLYVILAGPSRERLARDIADDIAGLVAQENG